MGRCVFALVAVYLIGIYFPRQKLTRPANFQKTIKICDTDTYSAFTFSREERHERVQGITRFVCRGECLRIEQARWESARERYPKHGSSSCGDHSRRSRKRSRTSTSQAG